MSLVNEEEEEYQSDYEEKSSSGGTARALVGKKIIKGMAGKSALGMGWPVVLGALALVLLVGIIGIVALLLLTSVGEDGKKEEATVWQGEISDIGENQIPAQYIPIYKAAAEKYDVPWNLLAAEHRVETQFSTMKVMESPVGAVGHLQFMPLTWIGWSYPGGNSVGNAAIPKDVLMNPEFIKKYGGYGVDANGDGKADPYDLEDAVYSAAHYLSSNGASEGRIRDAVYSYNHAQWYVEEVLGYADLYVQSYVPVESGERKSGGSVIEVGKQWIGHSTYVFGGGRNQGDIKVGNFDCSSFVHWAFSQVGKDLGSLVSTSTETLKHLGQAVRPNDIQPGDLVFFDTYKIDGHVGIYVGNGQFIGCQTTSGVAIVDMTKGYWKDKFNGRVRRL